ATYVDSTRAAGTPTLLVDAGGSFPEQDGRTDLAEFMVASEVRIGVGAMGVATRDLRHGVAFLRDLAKRTNAPLTAATLLARRTPALLSPPSRIVDVGGVHVGVFALLSNRVALGPAADSLEVLDPENAAQAEVTSLRSRGATVVVLLTQMGRAGGE